jgi:hypothetical protein
MCDKLFTHNKVSGRRLFTFIFIYKNHINFTFKIQINLHFLNHIIRYLEYFITL